MHGMLAPTCRADMPRILAGSLRLGKSGEAGEDGRPARQNSRTLRLSSSIRRKDADTEVSVEGEVPVALEADAQERGAGAAESGASDDEDRSEVRGS